MSQLQKMGDELVVGRSRLSRAFSFLVLLAVVLSARPPAVSGQLRRGDTSQPAVQVGAPGATTEAPLSMGVPDARMTGVEAARSTGFPNDQETARVGGGLRSQHTGSPVNVQAGIPTNVQPGSPGNAPAQNLGNPGGLSSGQPTAQSATPPVPTQQMRGTGMARQQQVPLPAGSQAVPMQQNVQHMRGAGATPQQQVPPPAGSQAVSMQQNWQQMRGTGMASQQQIPPAALPPAAIPQQNTQHAGGSGMVPQQQRQQQQQQQPPHQQQQPHHQHQERRQREGGWHGAGGAFVEDPHPTHADITRKPTGMEGGAVVLTDETFSSFIKSEPFALVLFYAPWCHWSRATLPEFDAVARFMAKVASRPIVLGKVNCDENPNTQKAEHILEYPIIKLYIDGKPKQYVGKQLHLWIWMDLVRRMKNESRACTAAASGSISIYAFYSTSFSVVLCYSSCLIRLHHFCFLHLLLAELLYFLRRKKENTDIRMAKPQSAEGRETRYNPPSHRVHAEWGRGSPTGGRGNDERQSRRYRKR